jgi:hypothetical protein
MLLRFLHVYSLLFCTVSQETKLKKGVTSHQEMLTSPLDLTSLPFCPMVPVHPYISDL